MATVTNPGFSNVVEYLPDEKEHRRQIARAVNQTMRGKLNAQLTVTLTSGATSTVIRDSRIGFYSVICPAMATTADAAAAIAAGIYVTDLIAGQGSVPGQATIHHASNAATDQTIVFLIIG